PASPVAVTFTVDIGGTMPYTVNWASNVNGYDNKADSMEYIGNHKWRITKLLQPDFIYEYKYVLNSSIDAVWEQNSKYTFIYNDSKAYKVQVAGEFNNWDTSVNAPLMKKINGTDSWITEVYGIEENKKYKFAIDGKFEEGGDRIAGFNSDNRKIFVTAECEILDDWCKLPDPPQNFSGTSLSETSVQLSWTQPEFSDMRDIISFKLYRCANTPDSGYELLTELLPDKTSYIDENLNINDTYYYRMTSVDTGSIVQEGFWSSIVSLKTQTPVPVIFNVKINGEKTDTVSWVSSANGYNPYQDIMLQSGNNEWTITKYLQPAVVYEYKYVINNNLYEEDAKYTFEYFDTSASAQKVQVAGGFNGWDKTNNAPLLRKISGTDTWITEMSGIQDNTEYKFVIDGNWESIAGNRKTGLSGSNRKVYISGNNNIFYDNWCNLSNPPENISAIPIDESSVKINFNASNAADIRKTGYYKLYRTISPDNILYQFIKAFAVSDTQYIDNNLINGATYYYRFTAVETGAEQTEGYFSDRIQATVSKPVNVLFRVDAGKTERIKSVRVAGDNPLPGWGGNGLILTDTDQNGIWTGILENVQVGTNLKYKYIKADFTDGDYENHSDRYINIDSSPSGIFEINDNWGNTPSAPCLSSDADSGKIILYWTLGDFDADTFYLYKKNNQTGDYVLVYTTTDTNYIDSNVNSTDTFYYKIKVQDGTGFKYESGFSDEFAARSGILTNVTFYLYSGITQGENNIYNFTIAGDFNNWNKTDQTLIPDSTADGRWSTVIPLILNKKYTYKYLYNKSVWEDNNREVIIKNINYDNWNDKPYKPELTILSDSGAIKLNININSARDIDIDYFEVYKNGNLVCTTVSIIYIDNNVVMDIPYNYQVKSVDFGGLSSDMSASNSGVAGKEIPVIFILDLRNSLISGLITEPQYGIGILGNVKPLTSNKLDNKMNKIKKGVYQFDAKFVTNNNLNYSFLLNPGTPIELKEESKTLLSYQSFAASKISVSGDFNGWNNSATPLTNTGSGNWQVELSLPDGTYNYKFVIDGEYEAGDNRTLIVSSERTISIYENNDSAGMIIVSEWSNKNPVPESPFTISAFAGSDEITLSWLESFEYGINKYGILRSDTFSGTFNNIGFAYSNKFTDNNVIPGKNYYYQIRPYDIENNAGVVSGVKSVKTNDTGAITKKLYYEDKLNFEVHNSDFANIGEFYIFNWNALNGIFKYDEEKYEHIINSIKSANNKIANLPGIKPLSNSDLNSPNADNNVYWVLFKDSNGLEIHDFNNYIKMSVKIPDTIAITSDTVLLKIFVLDETKNEWSILENSSVDTNGYLNIVRQNNSVYIILSVNPVPADLSEFAVYPNPFYKSKSLDGFIKFANIPADFESLQIYNINGELVVDFDKNQIIPSGNSVTLKWDVKNKYGREVASGIYIYILKTGSSKKIGKLGVVK
ncbi:MAG TPA: carbohydrate-binding module family 20 domain-containing protein, partial [bacterium]|nr:carbohydrate-binding module family 20 domain-containing protein [bacterium]